MYSRCRSCNCKSGNLLSATTEHEKSRLSQGYRSYFIFLYLYSVFSLLPKLPEQSVPSAAVHFCAFEMSWMHSSYEVAQAILFMTLSSSVTKFVVKKYAQLVKYLQSFSDSLNTTSRQVSSVQNRTSVFINVYW